MPNPTTRVLAVLELLQTHGQLSGTELARRLEIDRRTLRRYIVLLEQLGIPLTAERGRDGGYRLLPGFKLPPLMFTADEALAVSLGLLAARNLGLGDAAPAVASAQAKLTRVLPDTLGQRARAISETVRLDLGRPQTPGNNEALATLTAAAEAQQRVRLGYVTPQGEASERDFDPYGLGYRGGHWYAVGYCHLRHDLRSFRLDRMTTVRPLPASFLRPEGFDTLGYLSASVANLPRAHAVRVLLRTDLATARRHCFAALGRLEAVPQGVLLHAQADDLDWMARQLAALPFGVVIQAPMGLRTVVRAVAARLAGVAAGPRGRRWLAAPVDRRCRRKRFFCLPAAKLKAEGMVSPPGELLSGWPGRLGLWVFLFCFLAGKLFAEGMVSPPGELLSLPQQRK